MAKYDFNFSKHKITESVGSYKEAPSLRFIQIETERDTVILTFAKEQWLFITEMFADELSDQEKDELISRIQ